MSTNFIRVERKRVREGGPKYKYKFTLLDQTDVSILDKERNVIGEDIDFNGKRSMQIPTTPEILQARQQAAINFQSLVLNKLGKKYGELVVAYRRHAGGFPKFAQLDASDPSHKVWRVGKVTGKTWQVDPEEVPIPDKPA